MHRYILTGAPGSGKTALLRALELRGLPVVEEAATDVIALEQAKGVAEPWTESGFVDAVADLQRRRRLQAGGRSGPVVFDRSPVCTLALCRFLGRAPSVGLTAELDRTEQDRTYERRVLFVRPLGWVERTAARRISFEDSLRFEAVHAETYRELGYVLSEIPAGPVERRADQAVSIMAQASQRASYA